VKSQAYHNKLDFSSFQFGLAVFNLALADFKSHLDVTTSFLSISTFIPT